MDSSNLKEQTAPKAETNSGNMLDGLFDSILSVPESLMDKFSDLAIEGVEAIDKWVSGAAKAVANVFIPENSSGGSTPSTTKSEPIKT